MKLYLSPGGTWSGTEKDWKAAVKAEGLDHKTLDRKVFEVPTAKPDLMEWLTFHSVNPLAGDIAARSVPAAPVTTVSSAELLTLDGLFAAAPISQQLTLAVGAIDRANARIA